MSFDLQEGIVRILQPNDETAGTGFIVTKDGLIATCSHVVESQESQMRGKPEPEKRKIIFHATGEQREAQVESNCWCPSTSKDVTILRVDGDLPLGVRSLLLGSSRGTSNHSFDTFGFPRANPKQGILGEGHIQGETKIQDVQVLQLSSKEVTTGFSGAPVLDRARKRVVGMVTSILAPDKYGKLGEIAFIIPTETIQDVCSALTLSDICPYRNLEAFTEADSALFCGRQRVVDTLVESLQNEPRFLAVFGASGSGKSSLVQAGLIPRIRSDALPGNDGWEIIVTRPTDAFFKQHLANLDQAPTSVAFIIDQFEELFVSYVETARLEVITRLTHLLEHLPRVTLVIVMRDDFYSLLLRQEALASWLRGRVVNVWPTLKSEEVESIVRKPAELMGWRFEDRLVETIVEDVVGTPRRGHQSDRSTTILPLLEFTLTQLWERHQDGELTHAAYNSIGRITGGLRQWANNTYYTFDERLRPLVRRIFTDLVHLGDDEQHFADSRRRRALSSLVRGETEWTDVYHIVRSLVTARLLVTSEDTESNQEMVEIIHDALLWEWELLQQWVNDDRDFLTWRQEFERFMRGWTSRHDKNKLLRGRDLETAERWLKERKADLNQDEIAFLQSSAEQRTRSFLLMRSVLLLLVLLAGTASVLLVRLSTLPKPPDPTRVTNLHDDGPGSLRWDIIRAESGSLITFDPGLDGTIVLTSGNLDFTKSLMIRGTGAGRITISNGNTGHDVHILPGVSITFTGLSFRNSKTVVGFIFDDGTLTLTDSLVSGNSASSDGGGIFINDHSSLTLINSTVSDNKTAMAGGGIYNFDGVLDIRNSTISGNIAQLDGGGIYNFGTLSLLNSTISGNTAFGNGGGITFFGSQATIAFCTIYGNIAHNGGGISIEYDAKHTRPSQVEMQDSIVAGNQANSGPDVSGRLTSQGHNLFQDASGAVFVPNKQRLTDVSVGPHFYLGIDPILRDNGGSAAFHTYTHALLPGSPAIGRIPFVDCHFDGISTDQRGVKRSGSNEEACDIGAYERT